MMTHEFRFFRSFRRFQTVQPWNLDRFISSSDNSMIGLNFYMPIANPVSQNIEHLQDSQSRRSTESARTRSSFTRTYHCLRDLWWHIPSNGHFWSTTSDLREQNERLFGQFGQKSTKLQQQGRHVPEWLLWMDRTMVERRKSTGVSQSAYYTCNTRDSDTTGGGDIAGTRPPTNSEQRTIQTRTSPFSEVATTLTTSKKTKTFFSSTTPKRRCWWIDKRFRKLLKNRQRASNRVFLVTSSNIRCFSFFHSCPQPFHIMIRIPFDRDRISHGHLVHPLELAHLVYYWDSRKIIEQDQHTALAEVSDLLRRLSPIVAELVGNTQPNHPYQHMVPQITTILEELREELDYRMVATTQTFAPIPTPFIPYDACGRMRGLHDCYPAPILRRRVFPRSHSAPPTIHPRRTHQPWAHVSTVNSRSPSSSSPSTYQRSWGF